MKLDAQDLGFSIELLSLSHPNEVFNVSQFYVALNSGRGEPNQFATHYHDHYMKDQLRKHMFTKRIVKRLKFMIVNGISIELNSYALIRPTVPGKSSNVECCHLGGFCKIKEGNRVSEKPLVAVRR
ncbi:hypothetical protein JHK85_000622 [Glycine max]|nr:hypothetical protein JHK85_000622 [Glycine max]